MVVMVYPFDEVVVWKKKADSELLESVRSEELNLESVKDTPGVK